MEAAPKNYEVSVAMHGALYLKVKSMLRTVDEMKRDAEEICHKLSGETGMQFSFIFDAPNGRVEGIVLYRIDDPIEDKGQ